MKISFSVDVEKDLNLNSYRSLNHGIPRLQNILNKNNVKATFFVPARLIGKFPNLFKSLKHQGHEIAIHGLEHERFDNLSQKEKAKRIEEALKIYKRIFKHAPSGFRAPQHSIDKSTLKILVKSNFKYDSSYTPFNIFQFVFFPKKLKHGLIGFFKKRNLNLLNEGIYEFPISSNGVPFVSLPLRIFSKSLLKTYFNLLRITHKNLVFYCHSWDLISLPKSRIDRKFPHTKFLENLDFLVNVLARKDEFITLHKFVNTLDKKSK